MLLGVVVALLAVGLTGSRASATVVLTVTTVLDGHQPGTLRDAIDRANGVADLVTIEVPEGTYTLSTCAGSPDDDNTAGDLDLVLAYDITIEGQGAGAVVRAGCNDRIFDGHGSGQLSLKNLTLTGGRAVDAGGAVRANGQVRIYDSTLQDNVVDAGLGPDGTARGGAVASVSGGAERTRFLDNHVYGFRGTTGGDAEGGAVSTGGSGWYASGTTFAGNTAVGGVGVSRGGSARGGALAANRAVVSDVVFDGNEAVGGSPGGAAQGGGWFNSSSHDPAMAIGVTATANRAVGGNGWPAGGTAPSCTPGGGLAEGGFLRDSADATLFLQGGMFTSNEAIAGSLGSRSYIAGCATGGGGPAAGGAVWALGPDVEGGVIEGNRAAGGDGGVLVGCTCSSGLPPGSGVGGAVKAGTTYLGGGAGAYHARFSTNVASGGRAAMAGDPGGPAAGGAIFQADSASAPYLQLGSSWFDGNRAVGGLGLPGGVGGGTASGGAVYGGRTAPSAVTFSRNQALGGAPAVGTLGRGEGGGMESIRSDTYSGFSVATFDGNVAADGVDPAIGLPSASGGGKGAAFHGEAPGLFLSNSAITGSWGASAVSGPVSSMGRSYIGLPASAGVACDTPVTSFDANEVYDTSCGLTGPHDVAPAPDPKVAPLADNGGYAPTRMPAADSPLYLPAVGWVGPIAAGGTLGTTTTFPTVTSTTPPTTDPTKGSVFQPVDPFRLVDSRQAGSPTGGAPVSPSSPMDVTVVPDQLPVGATAVVMSVTVTQGSAPSWLAVVPKGSNLGTANLLYDTNQTATNLVTVGLGSGSGLTFADGTGQVHVVADVVGFYVAGDAGSRFTAAAPARVLDSRTATGGWPGPLGAGATRGVTIGGAGPVPASATAAVLNVTVTGGTAASYLRLSPSGQPPSTTANLLFGPGETRSVLVVVGLGAGGADQGRVDLYNQLGSVDVVADVVGWFDLGSGDRFHAATPFRVLDSRNGTGLTGPWTTGANRTLLASPTGPVPAGATAIAGNLTATDGTLPSYVSAAPTPGAAPATTANLLFGAGQTIPNAVYVGVGSGGGVDLYDQQGEVQLVLDVSGWFAPT